MTVMHIDTESVLGDISEMKQLLTVVQQHVLQQSITITQLRGQLALMTQERDSLRSELAIAHANSR